MDLELTDRVHRLDRLSRLQGVSPPSIEQVVVPPEQAGGATRPIPVIRVTFAERDFFQPGNAAPQPAVAQVLQVMVENMRRDVPDVRLTVLGHTDATGSERQNAALSQARATTVMQIMAASGANLGQLSAVAIGSAQPVAPNASASGRARNRRVEFLISPSEQANLAVVSRRPVNPAWLALGDGPARLAHTEVAVLLPRFTGPADFSEAPRAAPPTGTVTLAANGPLLNVGDYPSGSPVSGTTPPPAGTGRAASPAAADTGSPVGVSAQSDVN